MARMMIHGNLEARFWAAVAHRAAATGMTIASGCESDLKAFIATGVTKLASDGVANDEFRVAAAEANLLGFVGRMITESQQAGETEMHEYRFASAQAKLCPLWPFC